MRSSLNEKWLVCRVCLKQPKEEMETIFNQSSEKDMTHMIYECGGVPIKQFDHYPDKICTSCLRHLRVAYKFRSTCQRSHKHLSRFIAPVVVEKEERKTVEESEGDLAVEADEDEEINDVAGVLEENAAIAIALNEEEEGIEVSIKLESNNPEELQVAKQEEVEQVDFVDVFEPMDDDTGAEFEEIERSLSSMSEPAEYLDDFVYEVTSSDEEYVPDEENIRKKVKSKMTHRVDQKSQHIRQSSPTMNKESNTKTRQLQGKKEPRRKRMKETSFICDICGNIYPSQGRLTEHIKLHKGIKPHECEICGHAFAQTQQLARHMNTHTGNRPYKCSYCPAAFADLSTRNKHHRIHTNERPYVCDVCGKAFTYTNTLKFHKMIHTGEKPHVCDFCGKGFQQAYKLRNHKLTHEKKMIKVEKIEVETVTNAYQEVNAATAQILGI